MSNIMVSVLCATYNQERYIGQCLSSLVQQKTNFQYEVLVNDDASADHTPDIVREYAQKYPDIIKPVFQTVNQYSQHISIIKDVLLPRAQGKYFALCEGDDYWTDPLKLQKQVDYMEAHPECTLCVHNGIKVNEIGEYLSGYITSPESRIVGTEEVILGSGAFCMTNSILAPRYLTEELPHYFDICTMDFVWQMYLASKGTTYCFMDQMAAYRVAAIGSWTASMSNNNNIQKHFHYIDQAIRVKDAFDEETKFRYHNVIQSLQNAKYVQKYMLEVNSKALRDHSLKESISALAFKDRIRAYMIQYCPRVYKIIAKRKGWMYLP